MAATALLALPRTSLDLGAITTSIAAIPSAIANTITSALTTININTLLPYLLAVKLAFAIGEI